MFSDRNNRSSPGLRALLGRFLQGLLPHRIFQRVGAVWSYLMGPWDASSVLPSGWLVHRSVRSVELPEVLEALGLRSGSWEELGECLDELGPWKKLLTPEVDLDLLKSWKGIPSNKDEQSEFPDLTAWQRAMVHSNMQVFWEPGLIPWNDVAEPNHEDKECHKTASANLPFCFDDQKLDNELDPCRVAHDQSGTQLQSPSLSIISYILNVGTGEIITKADWNNDQNIDAVVDRPSQTESEIQHIRNKRLRFLYQNKTGEVFTTDVKQEVSKLEENPIILPELSDPMCLSSPTRPASNQNVDLPVFECFEGQSRICDQYELLSDVSLTHGNVLEVPEINGTCSSPDQLPVLVQEVDNSENLHHVWPPSSDKDQGYHSLEYWQCLPLPHNLTPANIATPGTCVLDEEYVLPALPTGLPACASFVEDKNDDKHSEFMYFDLQDEIPISSVTYCTNKHIGYILGTVVGDDDDTCPSSCDEQDKEEDDDDGFDSEGSMSTSDTESYVTQDSLWNSFCSSDPYNLQNFTASFQTAVMTRENLLPLETPDKHQSDEDSWCDSNAESSSDSESDCSADEEENLKLWNAFLKSDDPYNPLYFIAPMQTSDTKTQSCETASTYSEMVCKPLSNNKVDSVTHQGHDLQKRPFKEMHSMKDVSNLGHKKVTFNEKVTICYVCSEERKGHWEELARDRCRFQRRIKETEFVIGHCLTPDHRQRAWKKMQGHWGS